MTQVKMEVDKDIEKLYSPSQWSPRLGPDEIIASHIKVTTEESNRIRATVPFKTFKYGQGSEHERLDVFATENVKDDAPIFVYFSGGYWQLLNGDISSYSVGPLTKSGIRTIIVDYDRAPGVTVTQIAAKCVQAMKWIINYATEKKSSGIVFAGHSAGSHLCAMILSSKDFARSLTLEQKAMLKAVFHLSGVFNLEPLLKSSYNEALGMTLDEAVKMSPMGFTDRISKNNFTNVKHFVVPGEHDSPAFRQQSQDYAKALEKSGIRDVKLIDVKGRDHFDLVEDLADEDYEITKLIKNELK